MIAALSQIAQSALLVLISYGISQLKWARFEEVHAVAEIDAFDEASRGPKGSILLLYRLFRRP